MENDFNLIFKKQQNTTIKNKPLNQLKETKLKTSTAVKKEIKLININDILIQIENDNKIIESHNIISNKIDNLHIQLENYKNELSLLTTNDEYKYDPKCKYCCKRPWVCRINELQLNIEKINEDLIQQYSLIEVEDLNDLIETNEKNKIIKKSQEIFKFSNDNPLIHFARYSNYSGSNPDLAPHVDSFLEYPTYTFSIQLKTTKPEWIIRVDDHSFKLKENSCISFSGTHQIHSRDPIQFSDEDYCDIIVCQFTDNSYSSIKNDVSHQEIINNKFNIHRQKYRK